MAYGLAVAADGVNSGIGELLLSQQLIHGFSKANAQLAVKLPQSLYFIIARLCQGMNF